MIYESTERERGLSRERKRDDMHATKIGSKDIKIDDQASQSGQRLLGAFFH